jgi:ABC-2 type transport system ATP-binding protein
MPRGSPGVLESAGLQLLDGDRDLLTVRTDDTRRVGELAGDAGLHLHELTLVRSSLEEAFMSLTAASVDYAAGAVPEKAAA